MAATGIAAVAKLVANPTSAEVLDALLSDRELTIGGIASEIGAAPNTVSEVAGALAAAGLVTRERRGRVTTVRLAGGQVAEALEALGRLAEPPAPTGLRAVTRMDALRRGRTCYDHLAGRLGVELADRLLARGILLADSDGAWRLAADRRDCLIELGLDRALIGGSARRPLVRACLDWTEHRPHVAGRLGAAICALWLQRGMIRRLPGSRAVRATEAVNDWLDQL